MDKFLIIYNIKSIEFPLCGFVTEQNRNILLRKFKEYNRDKFVFYVNDSIAEVDCSEIIEALNNPFTVDMTKVPKDIVNYDPATYIARRERFFELQEDGTLRELPPGND